MLCNYLYYFILFILCIMIYLNFGTTNKCTILQSMYHFYYLASTCFGIAILRELTPRFHYNIQQYIIYIKHTFTLLSVVYFVKIILCIKYNIMLLI